MPFGYFPVKCFVENKLTTTEQLYLVGSSITDSGGKADKCVMNSSPLDLHISTSLGSPSGNYWTKEDYTLSFDAFQFRSSTEMSLCCNFEICLADQCDAAATQSCD